MCKILIVTFAILQNLDSSVLEAFNTEAVKLAAMGVTIIVASGDNGATGDTAHCPLASGIGESPGFTVSLVKCC